MDVLNEMVKLLEQWNAEMTARHEEARKKYEAAKAECDFYNVRMNAARNNLDDMKELAELMAENGGGK